MGSREHGLRYLWLPGPRAQALQLWRVGLVAPWHVGSSRIRDWACASYIGRWILYHWATGEAPSLYFLLWSVGSEFTLSFCVMGTVLSALHAFFSNSVLMTIIWYVGTLAISILQRKWKPMVMKSLSNIQFRRSQRQISNPGFLKPVQSLSSRWYCFLYLESPKFRWFLPPEYDLRLFIQLFFFCHYFNLDFSSSYLVLTKDCESCKFSLSGAKWGL